MKRSIPVMFLGLALIIFGMVRADAAASNGGTKVGFVDLQRTLVQTKVGKAASKRFETTKKKKQRALDKKQASFKKAAAELDRQKQLLKPAVVQRKQRELEKQYVEIQQTYSTLERELAQEQTKLVQGILKKAAPVIRSIAKKDGYTVILDRNAVLWASKGVDLTDKLNKLIK